MHTSCRDSATLEIGYLARINVVVTATIMSVISLSACTGMSEYDRDAVAKALADSTSHASETWNVRMDIMEDGRRFIHVVSPHATTLETHDGTRTTLSGPVNIEIRDTTGRAETTVQADKAVYHGRVGEFYFTGNVLVETDGGNRLRTEALTWVQQQRRVFTEKFVTIITPRDSIAGHGLRGDDRLINYEIERVTGSFTLDTTSN